MNAKRAVWERYLPGVAALVHYRRSWLRGDLLAGVTVAAYLVPQVMAYAVIAGLPAVVGLWSILLPMVIYFFLGTSRKLSIGPESTTALMTAAGVGALVGAAGGPERYAEVADYLKLGGNTDQEKLENLIAAVEQLKERVGIKKTIRDYGIDEKDFLDRLDDMVEQAFDDQCTGANPRYPLMSEIKQMFLDAYYGN